VPPGTESLCAFLTLSCTSPASILHSGANAKWLTAAAHSRRPASHIETWIGQVHALPQFYTASPASRHTVSTTLGYNRRCQWRAGTLLHIQTDDGDGVLSFAPRKQCESIVLSSPDLEETTYDVYLGGNSAAPS